MNVLVITPFLPCLGKHGGSAQMYNLWSHVQNIKDVNIHLLSHQTELEEGGAEQARQTFHAIDIVSAKLPSEWLLEGYLPHQKNPSKYLAFLTEAFISHLVDLLNNTKWDKIVIEMQFMMHVGQIIKELVDCPVGLIVHESMEGRYKNIPEMLRDFIAYEKQFENYIDFFICFSDEDKRSISSFGKPTYTLPLCVNVQSTYSVERVHGEMMFLGSYNHQPNIDAVDFLLTEILPLVKTPYSLKLYGAQLNDSLKEKWKHYPNVVLVGFVDDALLAMAQCHLMVVPIISGKGVRTKTVEALSQNTPIITTSLGAEGIEVVDGEDILIVDSPTDFAEAIDAVLQKNILPGKNAKNKVMRHSPNLVANKMHELLLVSGKKDALPVFPENTPTYIRLKYQYHVGLFGGMQSHEHFLEFLFKDAYWYGKNDCPTIIKMAWLESQSWAKALFDELIPPCGSTEMKFFLTAKIFYSVREDLKQKYILEKKYDFTGYLFDIYFGECSKVYCIGLEESHFLSEPTELLSSKVDSFTFCNAFYLLYIHKAEASLNIDINTGYGQQLFIAFLFLNSDIWHDQVDSSVVNDFLLNNEGDIVEYIQLLFRHYFPEKIWGRATVIEHLKNHQEDLHVHKWLYEWFFTISNVSVMGESARELQSFENDGDAVNFFEKLLSSADGRSFASNLNFPKTFIAENKDGVPSIIDDTHLYLEDCERSQRDFNACLKQALTDNLSKINPRILQNFIICFKQFSPAEIYVSAEKFRHHTKSTELPRHKSISVIGFSRSEIGTGEDTRNTFKALKGKGLDVSVFNIFPDGSTYNHQENSTQEYEVNQLSDIQIYTMPPPICMSSFLSVPQIYDTEGYRIGYFAWEFSEWKNDYNVIYDFFDEIWVISKFLLPAFIGNDVPVHYVPPVVTLSSGLSFDNKLLSHLNLPKDKFLFLFVFDIKSSLSRKNPIAIIKGFLSAFPNDNSVGLVLKFAFDKDDYKNNHDFFSLLESDSRIYSINNVLEKTQIESLIRQCDAMISLHRSEGFGRVMAEAMLLKTLVICTGYSGNMDYCNNETALLVKYNLVAVKPGEYPFAEGLFWADVSSESVVEQMMAARYDIEGNALKVDNAYNRIVRNHSLKTAANVMVQRLDELKQAVP